MSATNNSSKRILMIALCLGLLVVALGAMTAAASSPTEYYQNFEANAGKGTVSPGPGWFDYTNYTSQGLIYGQIVQVPSGTDGITSAKGGYHAVVTDSGTSTPCGGGSPPGPCYLGPLSNFGGRTTTWPTGGWVSQLDVYLDPAWPNGTGFEYDVASCRNTGTPANGYENCDYGRDYIMHVTKDSSTSKLLVGATNNSSYYPREDLETLVNRYEVTTAGWYTIRHIFRDQAGALAVDVQLLQNGTVVFTETRTEATDLIGTVIGGNRQSWFTAISDGLELAIDNQRLCLGSACGAAPEVKLTSTNQMVCDGGASLSVDFSNVANLYGYQFKVNYGAAQATANGSFVNTWFDTTNFAFVPGGWAGNCAGGVCQFAASKVDPATPLSGSSSVATVNFTPLAAGTFNATISNVLLTDIDGMPISADVDSTPLAFTVCGKAAISGKVALQGRVTPIDGGTITLIDPTNTFPSINATFDGAGDYSVANIPVLPGGTTYTIRAMHILYLGNAKTQLLTPGQNLTGQNTRLLGGDADNSGLVAPAYTPGVTTTDIGCIGGAFGGAPTTCGADPVSSTDINKDSTVNIQDLSIAGGNYNKHPFLPW